MFYPPPTCHDVAIEQSRMCLGAALERRQTSPTSATALKSNFLLVIFLFSSAGLFAQDAQAADGKASENWADLYEPHADDEMPYRLMKPMHFDSDKRYPVIVSLHGGGGTGTDNRKQLKQWNQQLADEQNRRDYPCYVLAPQATQLWGEEHLRKVQAIIAELPSVDMDRIYMMGHSMGGHGTNILIQIDPDYFAAVAPSAGTGRPQSEEFINPSLMKDIPIWAFHGDQDKVCPYDRDLELLDEMKKLGGNMKLTTFAGDGHGIAGKIIPGAENGSTLLSGDRCDPEPDFMKWLFAQKRIPDWVRLYEPYRYKDMAYRLMKPIKFDPEKSYPVIVSLHGGAGRGTKNLKQLRPWTQVLAEKQNRTDYPGYTIAPQSQERWNPTQLQTIKEIIKELPAVDTNRIYVLGHSMGAAGTYTFIQADPHYFAAAAPSAGRGERVDASVIKNLPLWVFHGDQDETVPIEGDQKLYAEMKKVGGNMKFTTWVGDGHNISAKFITGGDNGSTQLSSDRCDQEPVLLKWLFKHKLSD
ncbi:MAG: dienelactone hydrolase family protein [Verrucomicrobia bacterium]|nr:dienelactone hydrolase family protein [Verrucomicrobiota bacterium]